MASLLSAHISGQKLKNTKDTKDTSALLIAMNCPGYIMQIKVSFDREETLIRTKPPVELLGESLP